MLITSTMFGKECNWAKA